MAEEIGSLYATIGADTSPFESALGRVGGMLGDLGGIIGKLSFAGIFGAAVTQAADLQGATTQLEAALKSTSAASEAAAASQGHWAIATEMSGPKADKLKEQLLQLQASLVTLEAQHPKTGAAAEAQGLKIEALKMKIGDLTDELGINTAGQKVWVNGQSAVQSVTHMSESAMLDLAKALSQTTRFSQENVISTEALLLTFKNIGEETFPNATKAVLDIATAMHEDTKEAAVELGKALDDPVKGMTALHRVGVDFSDQQKELIKNFVATGQVAKAQAVILQEVQAEFGGSAVAAGTTFAGALDILHNSFDDLLATIGQYFLPALTGIVQGITGFVDSLQASNPGILQFIAVVTAIGAALVIIPPILAAVGGALGVITGPIGIIVAAVAALKLAWDNDFGGIVETVTNVWNTIQPILSDMANAVSSAFNFIFNPQKPDVTEVSDAATGGRKGRAGGRADTGDTDNVVQASMPPSLIDRIGTVFGKGGPLDVIGQAFSTLKDALSTAWGGIEPILMPFWNDIQSIVTWVVANAPGFWNSMVNWIGGAFTTIQGALSDAWAVLQPILTPILNDIQSIVTWVVANAPGFWNSMVNWIGGAFTTVKTALSDAWNVIQPIIDPLVTTIGKIISALGSGQGVDLSGISTALSGVKTVLSAGWDVVQKAWNETIKPILDAFVSGIGGFIDNLKGADLSGIEKVAGGIAIALGGILSVAGSVGAGALKGLADALPAVGAAIKDILNAISAATSGDIGKTLGDIAKAIGDLVGGLGKIPVDIVQKLMDFLGIKVDVAATLQGLGDQVSAIFGGIQSTITNAWNFLFGPTGLVPTAVNDFRLDVWDKIFGDGSDGGPKGIISNVATAIGNAFSGVAAIIAEPFKDAMRDIASAAAQIAGVLPGGATIAATINTAINGMGGGKAGGGDISAGAAYMVGEHGPELFRPKVSGSIVNTEALRTVGNGRGQTIVNQITGPITLADIDDVEGLFEKLQKHAMRSNLNLGSAR